MLQKEVHVALNLLAGALPARGVAFYIRRAMADGAYLRIAGDCEGLTGWTVEEWMARGGSWRAQVHPDDVDQIDATLCDVEDGEERTLEYRFLSREGGERWVRDSLRAIPGAAGGPWEVVGVLREAALERTLRAQVTALKERIWESQRMESLGALAGGVAHDFNNLPRHDPHHDPVPRAGRRRRHPVGAPRPAHDPGCRGAGLRDGPADPPLRGASTRAARWT